VVPWLCQQQLKEPLELLAAKLDLDAARLVLFCSDSVLAERMWFNPEGLAGLMEFVDELVAPDSFVSVVQVRRGFRFRKREVKLHVDRSHLRWHAPHRVSA
jgi:hypothetical protein